MTHQLKTQCGYSLFEVIIELDDFFDDKWTCGGDLGEGWKRTRWLLEQYNKYGYLTDYDLNWVKWMCKKYRPDLL